MQIKTNNTTLNAVASVLVSGIFATTGCSFVDESVGHDTQAYIMLNGFYFQSFGLNPTDENGLSVGSGVAIHQGALDGLVVNGRSSNGLKVSGHDFTSAQEANLGELFDYLVGCALDANQSVSLTMSNGSATTYQGELGLGTEWATGALSATSQSKVSACLAARTNGDDLHVKISLRSNDITTSATEMAMFNAIEGAFWGNAFGTDPQLYTCSADVSGIAGRNCTDGESCGFTDAGLCSEVCTQDLNDGHFISCNGSTNVVTVMLPYTKNDAFAGNHSCTANSNGSLSCWGDNNLGQVGDGTNIYRLLPVSVSLGTAGSVVEVAGGSEHSCARQANGTVTCWGNNTSGQLGAGSSATSINDPAASTSLIDDAMSLVSGANHSCALTADSTVLCWGENASGQLGDSSTTDSDVPTVTSSNNDMVRLATSGTSNHTCGVTEAGDLYCWGANTSGQLGDGTTTDRSAPVLAQSAPTELVDVCTGTGYTCALGANGTGVCFGSVTGTTTQAAAHIECSATSACFSGANGVECF